MEDINKDLVAYTTEQKEHFTAQAPVLFGNDFMKNATEHWEQVKALRKMRDRSSTLGFHKPTLAQSVSLEDTIQQRGTRCTKGAEMTINWVEEPTYCVANHMFLKNQQSVKSSVVEGTSNGSITTRGDITFGGWEVGNVYRHLEDVDK